MDKGIKEIFTRTSIRNFQDKPVQKSDIELLLKAAMQAPSAGNQQGWEFLVVDDKETSEKLSKVSQYATPAKKAPLCIIPLGTMNKMKYPENVDMDLSAATMNILLEAKSIGLGSVWMGVAPLDDRMNKVREIFGLSNDLRPFAIIPIGYPVKENEPKLRYDESKVHWNKY